MKALKKLNTVLGYICGILIVITAIILLYDVFCRYVLSEPTLWAQQIAAYMVLIATFFGTSYALQSGGHVHVEIIVDHLKPLPKKICMSIGYILAMIFVGGVVSSCYSYAMMAWQNGWDAQGNVPIPAVVLYGIMVVGSALLFITLLATLIQVWIGKGKEGETEC